MAALSSWQLPLWTTLALVLTGVVYARGWRLLRAQMPERFTPARLMSFLGGLAALFVAVASPLDAFAPLLLQVHMAQHLLLMMLAPPLFWLGAPAMPLLRGLPAGIVKSTLGPFLAWPSLHRLLRRLAHPLVSGSLFAVTLLVWHLPGPYQLALRSPGWHEAEHLAFLVAGLLFWWPVVQPWPSQPVWPRWTMVPYLLVADVLNTILAAFFTFSDRVIYPAYVAVPRLWGIDALEDQAIAGALMWVPGSVAFLVPAVWILVGLLSPAGSPRQPRGDARVLVTAAAMPRGRRAIDLLRIPIAGAFLRWRHGRRALQVAMAALAAAVVIDGLAGPDMAPMNLAGVLPWTHWRGLVVVALLAAGNLFCMACPFMLPRELAKRLLPARRTWPPWLRAKWLGAALLLIYLWAYETLAPWAAPRWTALIVLAYFGAAFAVDAVFRGASFCKYVCPIGQFHFVLSLASPLTVRPRHLAVCRGCATHDCLRGNAERRGCELDLFLPEKRGNLDCTFCLDCVAACPHDNVGILPATPIRDLALDPHRSSLRRVSERPDLAALALLVVFGAFANAAGMVAPVVAAQAALAERLALAATWPIVTLGIACTLILAPAVAGVAAAAIGRRLSGTTAPLRRIVCQYALACVPLGAAMWSAHFLFHFLTGAGALRPVVQRAVGDVAGALLGAPAWAAAAPTSVPHWLPAFEILLLDGGLLLSLYAGWRIASAELGRTSHALLLLAPWAALLALLWATGVWIIFQPMEMRGMIH